MGKAQWILPRSDRHYGAVERFVRTLPGIRHIIRLLVFVFYDIRFIAFRRYPGVSGISQLMKDHYRRRLKKHLDKYIKDDKLRQHMMPDYELGCRRVIPTNTYLPALSLDNVDVDISGIECITPQGIRTKDGKDIPLDVIVYATGYFAYSNMKKALTPTPDGLLLHENITWSLLPPHAGFRQYWRDFDSLERWADRTSESLQPAMRDITSAARRSTKDIGKYLVAAIATVVDVAAATVAVAGLFCVVVDKLGHLRPG